MKIVLTLPLVVAALVLAGCATDSNTTKGPKGTKPFYVRIESSEPGVTVRTNDVFAGKTPLRLRIDGDKLGTFHSLEGGQYVVSAVPLSSNQFPQSLTFAAGKGSSPGAKIPGFIFFDMNRKDGSFSLDTFPEE